LRTFAKELVDLRPDAILGRGTPETIALSHETRTIPIVFAAVSDPIGSGFAANLTHPGGNMTGFTNVESTVGGKWVELIKEIAPRTTHVALLFNPGTAAPTRGRARVYARVVSLTKSRSRAHMRTRIGRVIACQRHSCARRNLVEGAERRPAGKIHRAAPARPTRPFPQGKFCWTSEFFGSTKNSRGYVLRRTSKLAALLPPPP
jgi:ABC transporter substrate binding protein